MNVFTPQDELSSTLMKSIPRKVFHWLNRLEQDLAELGSYKGLAWKFSLDCGKLSYCGDVVISLSWSGHVDSISEIQGSDERFCDITNNLDWFAQLEKDIYDALAEYEESLSKPDDLEA
jgi:hypothetical protein